MVGLWPRWLKREDHSVEAMQEAKAWAAERSIDTNELLRGLMELDPAVARRLLEAERDQDKAQALYLGLHQTALDHGLIMAEEMVTNLRNFPTLEKAS